jgi:hypothetical protein
MNNMQLVAGLSCICPVTTTSVTINSMTYCIEQLFSFEEECKVGYFEDEQICLCDDNYNVSLVNGICS